MAERSFTRVTYAVDDGVARITLDRPDALNALDAQMAYELDRATDAAERDAAVRAVILTGTGKAFCAGGDLKGFVAAGPGVGEGVRQVLGPLHAAIERIARMDAPVIAAVNGVAAGAGLSLACACDLAIAASSARFTLAYTRAGLTPDGSSTYYLPRRVGLARALDLALTNRTLSAEEALEWGIVTRVVPDEAFADAVAGLASSLAAGATHALGEAKRLLQASWSASLPEQLEREADAIAAVAGGHDAQEGMRAFLEKRTPHFTGK